jgi:signal transduction histidine kinase
LNAPGVDLAELIQRVTDEASRGIGAELGAFVDHPSGAHTLYTAADAPKDAFTALLSAKRVIGLVRFDDHASAVSSYLAAPVLAQPGAPLGTLFFGHRERARFTEQHERMISAIASTASVAIERKRVEQERETLLAKMTEIVRANELFAGVLAHDLKNPLGAILSTAELALRKNESEALIKPLTRILASGERMVRMIDQLLDFTRLRNGRGLEPQRAAANLHDLCRRVIDELEDAYVEWTFDLRAIGDASGAWDASLLLQVISNLATNAVRHGDPSAPLRIAIEATQPEAVLVSFHNRGAIPAHLMPRIFDPFRGARHGRDGSRGLGLGLFITEQIVLAHGGQIEVDSSEERGTEFKVRLPRLNA